MSMKETDDCKKKGGQKKLKTSNGIIKGNKMYAATTGSNYKIKISNTSSTCKVNVMTKTGGPKGKGTWLLRLDGPHAGTEFNHININPKISNLGHDPHLKLPPGGLTAGKGLARFCQIANKVNKVAVPVAILLDAYAVGKSTKDDIKNKTSRNTVSTVVSVAGGWGGGYGGAVGGAAIGTAICPGIGTIIGGIIGGIGGGLAGSLGTSAIVDEIGDACDYDIIIVECKNCGKEFKIRKYLGDRTTLCSDCDDD